METTARIADAIDELTLDEAVHVFIRSRDPGRSTAAVLEDVAQRSQDGGRVIGGQDVCRGKRLRPRNAPGDVVFEERAIETEGDAEVEGGGIRSRIEATRPKCHARFPTTVSGFNTVHPPFSTER